MIIHNVKSLQTDKHWTGDHKTALLRWGNKALNFFYVICKQYMSILSVLKYEFS